MLSYVSAPLLSPDFLPREKSWRCSTPLMAVREGSHPRLLWLLRRKSVVSWQEPRGKRYLILSFPSSTIRGMNGWWTLAQKVGVPTSSIYLLLCCPTIYARLHIYVEKRRINVRPFVFPIIDTHTHDTYGKYVLFCISKTRIVQCHVIQICTYLNLPTYFTQLS